MEISLSPTVKYPSKNEAPFKGKYIWVWCQVWVQSIFNYMRRKVSERYNKKSDGLANCPS